MKKLPDSFTFIITIVVGASIIGGLLAFAINLDIYNRKGTSDQPEEQQPRYTYDYGQYIDLRAPKKDTYVDSTSFYKQRRVLKTIVVRNSTKGKNNGERIMKFEIELDEFPASKIDSIIKAHAEIAKGKISEMKIYDMAIDSNYTKDSKTKEKIK